MDNFSANKKDFFFFGIPLSDFFSKFVFSEVYVGFLMGAPTKKLIIFFSVISTWLEKKNETICPDALFLGNAMKAEFESWKKLRSQTPIFSLTGIFLIYTLALNTTLQYNSKLHQF